MEFVVINRSFADKQKTWKHLFGALEFKLPNYRYLNWKLVAESRILEYDKIEVGNSEKKTIF